MRAQIVSRKALEDVGKGVKEGGKGKRWPILRSEERSLDVLCVARVSEGPAEILARRRSRDQCKAMVTSSMTTIDSH
jgi:hypothetical protein